MMADGSFLQCYTVKSTYSTTLDFIIIINLVLVVTMTHSPPPPPPPSKVLSSSIIHHCKHGKEIAIAEVILISWCIDDACVGSLSIQQAKEPGAEEEPWP